MSLKIKLTVPLKVLYFSLVDESEFVCSGWIDPEDIGIAKYTLFSKYYKYNETYATVE